MKIIKHELNRIEKLIDQIDGKIFCDKKYENDLEWWILGRIATLLKEKGIDSPIYAAKNWREGDVFRPGKQKHLGNKAERQLHHSSKWRKVI